MKSRARHIPSRGRRGRTAPDPPGSASRRANQGRKPCRNPLRKKRQIFRAVEGFAGRFRGNEVKRKSFGSRTSRSYSKLDSDRLPDRLAAPPQQSGRGRHEELPFRGPNSPGSYELPDSILRGGLGWVEFEPVRGVTTSLISSGRVALIRDDSLRVALASWMEALNQLQVDEVQDGDLRLQVRGVVHDFVPMVSVDYRGGADGLASPSRFDADYVGLLDSREFENLLNFRRAKKGEILTGADGYERLGERLEWILSRLRSQLGE